MNMTIMNKKLFIILSLSMIGSINLIGFEIPSSPYTGPDEPIQSIYEIERLLRYTHMQFVNGTKEFIKVVYNERTPQGSVQVTRKLEPEDGFFFENRAGERLRYGALENRIFVYILGSFWNSKVEFSLGAELMPVVMQERSNLETAWKEERKITRRELAEQYEHSLITLRLEVGPGGRYIINPSIKKAHIR